MSRDKKGDYTVGYGKPPTATRFKKGQSGNPKGRPKGSRNALGEAFVAAMHEDFQEHGAEVIEKVRTERPYDYLKVIATIIPKEITHDAADNPLATLFEKLNQSVFPGDRFEPGGGNLKH